MNNLQVMVPDAVKDQAEKLAIEEHISLDEFTTLALVQRLSTSIPDPYLEERAKRGNFQRFREILSMAPDVPPEDYDRLQ